MSQSVSLSTVQNWEKDVDSLREWLRYDQSGGNVTRIFCELCHKHRDRLVGLSLIWFLTACLITVELSL